MALTKVPSNLDSVTATTQSASDNSTNVATTAYVTTAIANLADSAPSTLNTLNELAAALGDDANFSTTVTNSIATKLPLAGGALTGDLGVGITPVPGQSGSTTLHINSSNAGSYLRLTNSTTGSTTSDGFDILNVGVNAYVWNREDGNLLFGVDNTEKMRLTDDGELQLGTSIGSSTYAGQLNSVANLGSTGANIQTRNGDGNKHYILRGDNNVEYGFLGLDSPTGGANLLLGSADNRSIRMQSGGMQIELTGILCSAAVPILAKTPS